MLYVDIHQYTAVCFRHTFPFACLCEVNFFCEIQPPCLDLSKLGATPSANFSRGRYMFIATSQEVNIWLYHADGICHVMIN